MYSNSLILLPSFPGFVSCFFSKLPFYVLHILWKSTLKCYYFVFFVSISIVALFFFLVNDRFCSIYYDFKVMLVFMVSVTISMQFFTELSNTFWSISWFVLILYSLFSMSSRKFSLFACMKSSLGCVGIFIACAVILIMMGKWSEAVAGLGLMALLWKVLLSGFVNALCEK